MKKIIKNAWMTAGIFTWWLKDWNKELGKNSRQILLIVDNVGLHTHLMDFKNITLEFLPPNTTSIIQPLIKNLKTHYRRLLVRRLLKTN